MRGFEDIGSKGHFQPKRGFGVKTPHGGKREFFSKIHTEHFFKTHQDAALCKKSSKSDARISRYGVTNERMNAQTDEQDSIGLNADYFQCDNL